MVVSRTCPSGCKKWTREVVIGNSSVMGRLPVIVLSTILALAGMLQVGSSSRTSKVVAGFGGTQLDWAWAGCLLSACLLIWIARVRAAHYDSSYFEIGGIILLDAGLVGYLVALYAENQFDHSGIIVALVAASIINCSGRAVLLHRRMKELRRAIT